MKKWILLTVLLLAGCSEPVSKVYDSPDDKTETKKEQMDIAVNVYSLEQNSKGYVVKVDKRDKWILTEASAVYQHPKVLIETSTGQQLEGTVIRLDTQQNMAILHFRNSAQVKLENYRDEQFVLEDGQLTAFNSFDAEGQQVTVPTEVLQAFVGGAKKAGLTFDERNEARQQLELYPKVTVQAENLIDSYEKATFNFDRDAIEQYTHQFMQQYNYYVNKEQNDFLTRIGSDGLRRVFEAWESYGEQYRIGKLEVSDIQYANYQYIVQFTGLLNFDKQQMLSMGLHIIEVDGVFKVISFRATDTKSE